MSDINRTWCFPGVLAVVGLLALPQGGCNLPSNKDTPKATPTPETTADTSACKKDTDCKGDRICDNGTCRSPATNRRDPVTTLV